jgi:cytochrome c oxidase assembly protein subunit 11
MSNGETRQANRQMLVRLGVMALLMFGFGYAMVPFYQKLCQATGITNLLQSNTSQKEVTNTQVDTARWVTLEFDTNTHDLPWQFRPLQRSVRVHPGAMTQVDFEVRNNSAVAMVGQAIPSYGPKQAQQYVKKLECFCFRRQALAPGEVRQMPVQLVIDSSLPAGINTLTLSYTFFEVKGGAASPDEKAG